MLNEKQNKKAIKAAVSTRVKPQARPYPEHQLLLETSNRKKEIHSCKIVIPSAQNNCTLIKFHGRLDPVQLRY